MTELLVAAGLEWMRPALKEGGLLGVIELLAYADGGLALPGTSGLVYREARTKLSNRLYRTGEVPGEHAAELPEHIDTLIAFAKAAKPDSYLKRLFAARSPDDASSAAAATPGSKASSAAAAIVNAPDERRHRYGAHRATVEETRRDAANAAYAVVAAQLRHAPDIDGLPCPADICAVQDHFCMRPPRPTRRRMRTG